MCVGMTQEKISDCSLQSSLGSVPFPVNSQIIGHCPTKSDQSSKGHQGHIPHESFTLHKVHTI